MVIDLHRVWVSSGGCGWRCRNGCVVVGQLSPRGEGFSVVEIESVLLVADDLDAHTVGLEGEHVDFAVGLNDQSVLEDIIVGDVSVHLEDLEGAKIGTHFLDCVNRVRVYR